MYKLLLLPLIAGCLGGDVSVTPQKTDDDGDGFDEPGASKLETGLAIGAIVAGAAIGALSDSSDDD